MLKQLKNSEFKNKQNISLEKHVYIIHFQLKAFRSAMRLSIFGILAGLLE